MKSALRTYLEKMGMMEAEIQACESVAEVKREEEELEEESLLRETHYQEDSLSIDYIRKNYNG